MNLRQILGDVVDGKTLPDTEISGLYCDSRQVEPGGLFFALPGAVSDGSDFVDAAVAAGAVAVVAQRSVPVPDGVAFIKVEDARYCMAQAAAAFYGHPARDMLVVGVTGTNGKTTVTCLVEQMLRRAGYTPAVIGTINNRCGDYCCPAEHTTPESLDLQRMLADFRRRGADALVMEVSSHALAQRRSSALSFAVTVFTNLTPEHLDYHKNMENYFQAKSQLFIDQQADGTGVAVINSDDPYGAKLVTMLDNVISVGHQSCAAVRVVSCRQDMDGTKAQIHTPSGMLHVNSPLVGHFNLENILCAVGVAQALKIDNAVVEQALAGDCCVPGRLQRIENDLGAIIVVDYAHTGDALEKALQALVALKPRRVITVFGCGGDRDNSKRPQMGEIAARYSDLVIITSDNPRSEDPDTIMEQICVGAQRICQRLERAEDFASVAGGGYVVIGDRAAAIASAVALVQEGDLLLVAGKGHEDYQIIAGRTIHFDDGEQIVKALQARRSATPQRQRR